MIHKVRKSTPRFTSLVLIRLVLTEIQRFKVAQNSNISVRSLGSNAPFSAGNHAITPGFVR